MTSRVPTITASREPAVVSTRNGLTGSLVLIWPKALALRNSASERVSRSPSSGDSEVPAICCMRMSSPSMSRICSPCRSRLTNTRKSLRFFWGSLGSSNFGSQPPGDGGIVSGIAGDDLQRPLLGIIGDDPALVPCLPEFRIAEDLGGFIHRLPKTPPQGSPWPPRAIPTGAN